jgi:outer membrane cobalamin receptor
MIGTVALLLLLQGEPAGERRVRGAVVDATTGAAVVSALVTAGSARTITDEQGAFRIPAFVGDTVRVARVGYRPYLGPLSDDTVRIALEPVVAQLGEVVVTADAERIARLAAERGTADARASGATELADAVAQLPYVSPRSGRAGVALSMRGSRAEQVLVVLDGLPLNDPATGAADLSDVPLAAVGGVTAMPGSDASRWGSGATGGVLLLSSATGSLLSASAGAYGRSSVEGAFSGDLRRARVRAGAALTRARNDFPFIVDRGASGLPDSTATRDDADEQRVAVFATAVAPRAQLSVFASRVERGLARPVQANVARMREERRRGLARAQLAIGHWSLVTGMRILDLGYHDPAGVASGSALTASSIDAEAAREFGRFDVRGGAGADRVRATSFDAPDRPRGFAAVATRAQAGRMRVDASLRGDAVRDAGAQLSPSLAVEWQGPVTLFARAARAFRAPTFHDLYFVSQTVLGTRVVRPERVTLDGELGGRVARGALGISGSAFVRRTRDAIVWLPGSFSWSPSNVRLERVTGAEARLTLAPSRWPIALDGWAGAYRTDAAIDGVTVPTPYAPLAAGGATLRADVGPLRATSVLTALGRRPYQVAARNRELELPGVALVDVALAWERPLRAGTLLVTTAVHDVADVRWEPVRRLPAPGRSWSASAAFTF